MMAGSLAIDLNDPEQALLKQIELDALALQHGEPARKNAELAAQLMKLLADRKAVPAHRLEYFTDPNCNIGGRGKSHREQFERNGMRINEIVRHPHFLAYLRYFIYGPDLPAAALSAFHAKVEECGMLTSGDIMPLAKFARQLTRTHRLDPRAASEEFFKLGLEHGMSPQTATFIRDQVRAIR